AVPRQSDRRMAIRRDSSVVTLQTRPCPVWVISRHNAAGGVRGKKLDLSIGDDACYAEQAVAVANQMTESNVVLVAGHYCSSASIAASQFYAKSTMVQISPGSTNPALPDDRAGPNIYRVCGRDDQQGSVAGKY